MAVVVTSVLAWDQTGLVAGMSSQARVAGVVYERTSLGTGYDGLGRLRLPEGEPASTEPPGPPAAAPGEIAIAPPPEHFDAPPPAPAPPPRQLRRAEFDQVVPSGGTWAVMIGINDYPGSRYDLRSAVADVEDVNTALGQMGVPGSNRLLIRDRQATAGTIRAAADWLRAHAGPDAVAVFFYAGHVRKLSSHTEAIVGADGGLVRDTELAEILDGMQARRAWIGIAACYAGGFTELRKAGRVITAAAPANQLAYENEAFGRSYLVEFMVRRAMLGNRAPSSVEAAFAWARGEIARDYPNRVPMQFDDDPAELDLRPRATTSSSPPGSSPSPSPSSTTTTAPPTADATPPPSDPDDDCGQLTGGIVRCGD